MRCMHLFQLSSSDLPAVAFRVVDRDSSGSIELPELEELLRNLYLRNAEMAHGHEGRHLQQSIEAGFT